MCCTLRLAGDCDRDPRGTNQTVHLEERHRRLTARLLIALGLTLLVLVIGSVLIWTFESRVKGGGIHGYGDALFFTAVQLLTISPAITNPLTADGKVVDAALEIWAPIRRYEGAGAHRCRARG
jgi:hypothetical protein